ncbi:hypothetical protein [Aestuariivivens sp. NBU2969]|uniref:hypothetical protein n=1 Tax=Aestuariivivens sp. NBU2969 TaxID=2873267 RepID=UPI001CC0F131|nr:hypothetical protein [Aestuariivivens sp. NBU2969]
MKNKIKFFKKILLVVVGCILFGCIEKETSLTTNNVKLNLIPQPNAVKTYAEKFVMDESTVVYYPKSNEELKKQADVVNEVIFNHWTCNKKLDFKLND